MSGISSGVGLISGINTAQLIEQLMAIESRPITTLQGRAQQLDVQRAAVLALSAKLLAIKESGGRFKQNSFFQQFTANSTNDGVATAAAREGAAPGTYSFRVHSLVASHAVISRSFADADRTPVGTGRLTIELGNGRVDRAMPLSLLNGGAGIRRGVMTITDRAGATADIDLRGATSIDDVLTAINTNGAVGVRARVTGVDANGAVGDRMVIEDLSGGTGNLIIADKSGSFSAQDLGIAANVAADRIDGRDLIRLTASTPLSLLNDGNGIGRLPQGATESDLIFNTALGNFGVSLTDVMSLDTDLRAVNAGNGVRLGVIRITDRAGKSVDVDLADQAAGQVQTIRDVRQRILDATAAAGVAVSVTVVNSHLQITDTSGAPNTAPGKLTIEDIGGFAAADLGILGTASGTAITGKDIYRVATVGDLINAINYASGNAGLVNAQITPDGNAIHFTAQGVGNTVTVAAGARSTTAQDLGILGATFDSSGGGLTTRRYLAGLNTVLLQSLNGGRGVGLGTVTITDRAATTTTIDFSIANTLQDVIDIINADGVTGVTASINAAGNGIALHDDSGGTGDIIIADDSGTLAADLGLAGTFEPAAGATINGGNRQVQYVSRQTRLVDLPGGQGVSPGNFRITDSQGAVYTVNVSARESTIGAVIDLINGRTGGRVEARLNDTGDGILLTDLAGGAKALTVEDVDGGQAAAQLRLAGTARPGENDLDGSFEIRIDVGASDTLRDIVAKLNRAAGVTAAVINDGSSFNPFSLTVTSTQSGLKGRLNLDAIGVDLGFGTLTDAQDAVVSLGGTTGGQPLLITGSSNTLDNVIPGVSLNLVSASKDEVSVTVAQNIDSIVNGIKGFVERYNEMQSDLENATRFNADTLERGTLFGDPTAAVIRDRMQRLITRAYGSDPAINRLSSLGVRAVANHRLEFNEQQFREAYQANPAVVEQFFTTAETGFGAVVERTFDDLTRNFDGVIARKDQLLQDQRDLINRRIDRLNVSLAARRRRLEIQFAGLESSLANLQDNQNSLALLAQLAGNVSA